MPTGIRAASLQGSMQRSHTAAVDLYWIPLGAGGHFVRFNGRVFDAVAAARRHRQRCDLYHAALVVELDSDRYTIELAPSPNADEASRGVVATGAVGSRYAGRLRAFRYEVRCGGAGRSRISATRSAGPAASAATRRSPGACSSSCRARRGRSGAATS